VSIDAGSLCQKISASLALPNQPCTDAAGRQRWTFCAVVMVAGHRPLVGHLLEWTGQARLPNNSPTSRQAAPKPHKVLARLLNHRLSSHREAARHQRSKGFKLLWTHRSANQELFSFFPIPWWIADPGVLWDTRQTEPNTGGVLAFGQ
jgi:hypothetical protein